MRWSWLRRCGAFIAVVAALGGLGGCATGFLLDTQVQSFATTAPPAAGATYRFDRLPSQQQSPLQAQLEAMADPALFKAGLKRDDASPRYGVQVSARVQRILSPWADPWDGWGGGFGFGMGGAAFMTPFPRMEQPWYQREVGIVIRELATQKVAYETHAASDGPWSDNTSVLPAMFEAALQGFPNPPAGPRRIAVQVGR